MEKRAASLALVDDAIRRISGHLVGSLVSLSADGAVVDYPGNSHGPLLARSTVAQIREASAHAQVLLVFDAERSDRPVIVGLLNAGSEAAASESAASVLPAAREALVDGKRVVIDAQDEIVLRCGKASITLRRNGRVIIRGAYVETRAEGVNRIKGGSVQIN
jgi:hypothetical protein